MNRAIGSRLWRGMGRAALQLAITALGVVAIVGSGGGMGDSVCDVYPDSCGPQPPPPPTLAIDPPSLTVQVGSPASFAATVANGSGTYSYQWRRSNDGGSSFVDIPGATTKVLTLASVNLADDGAVFMALAWQGTSLALQATAQLAVSTTPGVVFSDADFPLARWKAAPAIVDGYPSFAHTEEQSATDGNPGAYRLMSVEVARGSSVSNVTHLGLTWTYDPAAQGAIRSIDYSEDCILLNPSAFNYFESSLFIEQSGRRYLSDAAACARSGWAHLDRQSLLAQDFRIFDGPPCGLGESCPDFSATGAPMRLGYVRHTLGEQGEIVQQGIDNWKVTIWRR